MLHDQHRDITMAQRLFKVAAQTTLLSTAALALLVGIGAWLGLWEAPLPLGFILAITVTLGILWQLLVRYYDKRSVIITVLGVSGLLALVVTYLGGLYGAIV